MNSFSSLADPQAAPWFVGWGTLALINAGLAQGKNRSGLLWFLLSLVLGPIATLVLVLLPKVRQKLF
ncbi:antitermination protein NusB [Frateuria soli]|uniref:antitermination protein NusB n=1 Tax=Frateuria soli TaxID=1542730 RepID=UPI001E5C870E|nr:antitermination protein NusB [Frateuria soli]UGB38028.1 antitermination protein NusB [Frateuria soli]